MVNSLKSSNYEKPLNEFHQEFIEQQGHCILCGSELELQHVVDPHDHKIKEEAHCPECKIRARSKIHTLN